MKSIAIYCTLCTLFPRYHQQKQIDSNLSVLWLDEVGEGLWLTLVWVNVTLVAVGIVVVVVVSIILWANVLHLVDGTALWAALDWALAGHLLSVSGMFLLASYTSWADV